MISKLKKIIIQRKYEVLLLALVQHLFIGIFLNDLSFYTYVIWPINMLILGISSIGVFQNTTKFKKRIRIFAFILVLILPLIIPFQGNYENVMAYVSLVYIVYFSFIFSEVLGYLFKPSYINADIISASACGYLLLLEVSAFTLQYLLYQNPNSFKGIDISNPAATYMDIIYYCSITLTSIGFGDITPTTFHTKLLTSVIGIVGQFYVVVLVGILISKFTSRAKE